MARRIFLHLGPPKTGTTFLQNLLYANQQALQEQGIQVVGTQAEHHQAANELMSRAARRSREVPHGAWARLRSKVSAFEGDTLLSCERYSLLEASQVRLVHDAFPDHELHVVFTLRDATAVLPSRWQERVKNGGTISWSQFCARVTKDPRFLQNMLRAAQPLTAWSTVLPRDRVHVVTVPPAGSSRTLLLERFCEVVGADSTRLDTLEARRANTSMDLAGTELVRRINDEKGLRLSPHVQHSEIKTYLADGALAARRDRLRPRLTEAAFDAARRESEALVERIREGGYPVVGDLADLTSAKPPSPEDHVADVPPEQLVEVALEAVAALAGRSFERRRRIAELERRAGGATDRVRSGVRRLPAGITRRLPASVRRRLRRQVR